MSTAVESNGKATSYTYDAAGNITAHNVYGRNLVSRSTGGQNYYYLYNAHGDVVMLLDVATGEPAGTYSYDEFGTLVFQTGHVDNRIPH